MKYDYKLLQVLVYDEAFKKELEKYLNDGWDLVKGPTFTKVIGRRTGFALIRKVK